jgi:hypothetical protein
MQRTIHASLGATSQELARFLGSHLPLIGGANWWQTHVVSQLTYGQQGQVRTRGIDRPGGLDLAALIRVFDRNWAELSYQSKLPDELRTHVKELADIRNATSHTAAEGSELSPHDAYRYLDTMARVLKGLSADSAVMVPIETARTEVMRAMAGAPAPAIEPVIEIREVVREVIREVPVEVIKHVRVETPVTPESEPEGGIKVGDFRLHGPGEAVDGTLPGFDGKEVEATLIPWTVYGDGGLCLGIQVAMINEGTAVDVGQVVCTSRNKSPQVWDDVVQRLRIGIRDAGEGMWTMELRSAVRPGGGRATRNVWSLSEFREKTGLSLEAALKSYGAEAVGTRAEVLDDTGKNRNFPCALFSAGDSLVPAAAWVLVTLRTLLS